MRTVVPAVTLMLGLPGNAYGQALTCGLPGVYVEITLPDGSGGWSKASGLAQGMLLGRWMTADWPSGPLSTSEQQHELCYKAELLQQVRGVAFVRVLSGFRVRGEPGAGSHELIVAFTLDDAAIVPLVPADTAARWKVPSPDVINALMARQPAPSDASERWAERRSVAALVFGQSELEPHFTATECRSRDALLLARSFQGRNSYYEFRFAENGLLRRLVEVTTRPRC